MIKNAKYLDFFPYPDFRYEQESIIRKIEESVRLRKNILLVSPNGTGKTIIALSAVLPVAYNYDLKIVYMCRTHSQSARAIKELQKIYSSSENNYKVSGLSIRGRNEMCLNTTLLRMRTSPTEAMSICKNLRANRMCSFYKNVNKSTDGFKSLDLFQFDKPVDAEELIGFCKEKNYCPYFLSRFLLKKMPIIVCNFQWLFNPDIRFRFLKLLGMDLNRCILIIDECHNIVDVATEVNSDKLTPYFLKKCVDDLNVYRLPERYRQFVNFLKNHLNQKKIDIASGELAIDPEEFLTRLSKKLKLKNITQFKGFLRNFSDEYKQRVELLRNEKDKDKEISDYNIKNLVKFWFNWIKKSLSEKFFFCYKVKKSAKKKFISLEIVALDPRDITLPIFSNSFACVNLTGTVNPQIFNYLTGLNLKKKGYEEIIGKSLFKSKNILALIIDGVNTKNENRKPFMYQKIIEKVEEVIVNTPANVGIFCASYKILNDLRMNGIIPMIQGTGKKLFIEDTRNSASDNANLLNKYKLRSRSPYKGAVLLGVCGGRNCEGEDYPGDFMNGVIIIGIPYHLQTPRVKAKITFYNKAFNNQGWPFAYLYPAMQRANQASGRPIRKENDKGVIVFMDSRFKEKKGWISDWVRNEIKLTPNRKGIISSKIKNFWNKKMLLK